MLEEEHNREREEYQKETKESQEEIQKLRDELAEAKAYQKFRVEYEEKEANARMNSDIRS